MSSGTSGRSVKGWSVFAIDPGETTGWAWACVGVNEPDRDPACGGLRLARRHRSGVNLSDVRVAWGQVPLPQKDPVTGRVYRPWEAETLVARTLVNLMMIYGRMGARSSSGAVPEISKVILEDFILRERTKDRSLLSPVRIGAKTEALYFEEPSLTADIEYQSASSAKTTITDERLQRWGFWQPGQPHACDALRHLLLYMREVKSQT